MWKGKTLSENGTRYLMRCSVAKESWAPGRYFIISSKYRYKMHILYIEMPHCDGGICIVSYLL